MLARAASPRHVPPLGTRSMIDGPCGCCYLSLSHPGVITITHLEGAGELRREGAVLAGVERGDAGQKYVCGYVCAGAWIMYGGGMQVGMR
jgi:hypothetical protein